MKVLGASSGEVADHNQLNTPPLTIPFWWLQLTGNKTCLTLSLYFSLIITRGSDKLVSLRDLFGNYHIIKNMFKSQELLPMVVMNLSCFEFLNINSWFMVQEINSSPHL